MIAPLLCGLMLVIALMRVAVPVGQRVTGEPRGAVSLRFRERLRLQRVNIYLIGVVLVLGTVGGWLRFPLNLIVVLATYVIVSIPVQYSFTAEGVACNRVVFRRWEEFSGVAEERGRVRLRGAASNRDFALVLAPDQYATVQRLIAVTPLGNKAAGGEQRAAGRGKGRKTASGMAVSG